MTVEERRALIARRDPEKVRAADRARHERDREKRIEAMKKYGQQHPEKLRASARRFDERHPEQKAAVVAVNNAVRDGRLVRRPCETCGATEGVQGHHDDYSKPLEVRWLCVTHHHEHHVAERRRQEAA